MKNKYNKFNPYPLYKKNEIEKPVLKFENAPLVLEKEKREKKYQFGLEGDLHRKLSYLSKLNYCTKIAFIRKLIKEKWDEIEAERKKEQLYRKKKNYDEFTF